ncbi:hypothetical protein T484DRAFT_1779828, partial [Baffinella frigidus]
VTNERQYLSLGAVAGLVVGTMTVLFALCTLANAMLMSMGYAFHGCHQMAFLVSFVVAALATMFVVGLCWICTRPWTALLLLFFSLLGEMSLETGEASSVILWTFATAASFYVWIKWGKHFGVSEDPYGPGDEKAPLLRKGEDMQARILSAEAQMGQAEAEGDWPGLIALGKQIQGDLVLMYNDEIEFQAVAASKLVLDDTPGKPLLQVEALHSLIRCSDESRLDFDESLLHE